MSDFSKHKAGSATATCSTHDGRQIVVEVTDKHRKKPFKGALVKLTGPSSPSPKKSGENGKAIFEHLDSGKYYAEASHPGYSFVPEGEVKSPKANHLTLLAIPKKVRWGCDSNQSTIDIGKAHSEKVTFLCRYLSDDGDPSHPALSPAEMPRYHGSGLDLVAIWEKSKYRAFQLGSEAAEHQAGMDDAHAAAWTLQTCGVPGKVVYFTADFTVGTRKWNGKEGRLITAYFEGIKKVMHPSRIGAYGTYVTLKNLLDAGTITYAWQMIFGKKGAEIDDRVQLYQYDIWPSTDGWGVGGPGALDLDCAVAADFGQFSV